MDRETEKKRIVYFHLEEGQRLKKHLFKEARMPGITLDMEEGYELLFYFVPEYYANRRCWDKDKLLLALDRELKQAGAEQYYIQPKLCHMLDIKEKLPPEILIRKVLKQNPCWEYLLLIGSTGQEEALFLPLIQEYLPRINHFTVITDTPEEYREFADYIYEEYGIPTAYSGRLERRLGKKKRTVVIDSRSGYKPSFTVLPEEAFYIDFWSEQEKRSVLETKRKDVRYLSVVKFLDTLAENGYNTIVNQTYKKTEHRSSYK